MPEIPSVPPVDDDAERLNSLRQRFGIAGEGFYLSNTDTTFLLRLLDSRDAALRKAREELAPLRAAANFLFGLLDDIDTAGDMAKADDKAFRAMTERLHRRRFEVASTDGYTVTFARSQETKPDQE